MPPNAPTPDDPLVVTFVCTGNICRSPIAEHVLAHALREEGLDDRVRVDSAGLGDWHVGEKADPRARAVLRSGGFDGDGHRARQLDPGELASADLVVALDAGHEGVLRAYARTDAHKAKVRLLRSFDPQAGDDLDVADPYYGDDAGFDTTLAQVRAAVPGLLAWVRAALDDREDR
ncbi:low molecular weight protein-tyrosine-phosphatase [Thalassiella azotivora]